MIRFIAIDPTETHEVDFCRVAQERAIRLWRDAAERSRSAGNAEAAASAEAEASAAEADLAGYQGDGPRFILGLVPGEKRALIAGLAQAAEEERDKAARATAEHRWRRELVRWAIRGHRNVRKADGSEMPFAGETVRVAGEEMTVPTERQIEVYAASGIFADLAAVAIDAQRLGGAEKNG
jgi:hypothetical protein